MIKRALFRVQPIEQLRKRKQRKRDMWERHQQFRKFVERVKGKKAKE